MGDFVRPSSGSVSLPARATAVVLMALALAAAPGCAPQSSAPVSTTPTVTAPSVPTGPEILAAAVKLSSDGSAAAVTASNPETIGCPKAVQQGWRAYEVDLTAGGKQLPRFFIKYDRGEWTRLEAKAPCLACHKDPGPTPPVY
jgi:hypothetical protein